MSTYTISIMDKLQEAANGQSLQDLNVLRDVAKSTLFGPELDKIDEKYRDEFVTGFALHYFMDEIGMETWPLWRMALMEKIYNNYQFINQTYDFIDTQVFDNFTTRKTQSQSTGTSIVDIATKNTSVSNGESSNQFSNEHETTGKSDVKSSQTSNNSAVANSTQDIDTTVTTSGTQTNDLTDATKESSTGTTKSTTTDEGNTKTDDTTSSTLNKEFSEDGTHSNVNSNNSNTVKTGEETKGGHTTVTNSGNDILHTSGSSDGHTSSKVVIDDHTSDRGYTQLDKNGGTKTIDKPEYKDTTDVTQQNSDTPQNGLDNVKELKYLTSAAVGNTTLNRNGSGTVTVEALPNSYDKNNLNTDHWTNGTHTTDNWDDNHDDHTSTTTHGLKTDTFYDETTGFKDYSSNTTGGSTDNATDAKSGTSTDTTNGTNNSTTTHSNTVGVDGATTDERTGEQKHTGTVKNDGTQATDGTVTDHSDQTSTGSVTGNVTNNTTGNGTDSGNSSGTSKSTTNADGTSKTTGNTTDNKDASDLDKHWSYEMFMSAESILNRVWRMFDDLFMLLI